ncbi:MAG: hypothetical protein AB1445_08960 [Bacillota bacterium]
MVGFRGKSGLYQVEIPFPFPPALGPVGRRVDEFHPQVTQDAPEVLGGVDSSIVYVMCPSRLCGH